MPNAGIHLLVVHSVLDRWRGAPSRAPFDPRDQEAACAFAHGSLAADIGYFPGGDRLFSELAHLVGPADLARELIASARTPAQQGYAWGWATHVIADAAIHPLLNEAGGERLHGDRARPVSSTEDVLTHMRLEYGLDAAIVGGAQRGLRCDGAVGAETVAFLADVFRRVYGWSPAERSLAASHRLSPRLARIALALDWIHGTPPARRTVHRAVRSAFLAVGTPVRRWAPGYRSSGVLQSVLEPIASPRWLIDETTRALDEAVCMLDEACGDTLDTLPNRNLVTGASTAGDSGDERTASAVRMLRERRDPAQYGNSAAGEPPPRQ